MAGKIEQLNEQLKVKLDIGEGGEVEHGSTGLSLDDYGALMQSKKPIKVNFTACSPDGTLTAFEGDGIVISFGGADAQEAMPYFTPYLGGRLLGMDFDVYVSAVDTGKKVVSVKSARKARSEKSEVVRELIGKLDSGQQPVVIGRIDRVMQSQDQPFMSYAYVDIFNQGIRGSVRVNAWNGYFLRYLNEECKEGEYYQFVVTGKAEPTDTRPYPLFHLSHKEFAKDPWEMLALEKIEEGGTIAVRCIEREIDKKTGQPKSYFWGRSDRLRGIEIQMNIPSDDKLSLFAGITYNCKIKAVRTGGDGGRLFRVNPFAPCKADMELYAKAREIAGRAEVPADLG